MLPTVLEKSNLEVLQKLISMVKVQNFAGISSNLPFSEFDFYDLYRKTFEKSDLGRIRQKLPLHEMTENFGPINKSIRPKVGRRSYFTTECKGALIFFVHRSEQPETEGASER